jgi:glyoxylase I family protein
MRRDRPGIPPVQETAMKLRRIHHVAIICSDYARTRHFYVEVLGLAVRAENLQIHRGTTKLDLALPDAGQLEIFHFAEAPRRPSYPEAQGLRHLAFEVDDVVAARAYLQALNIAVEDVRIDEYTGRRFVFLADPDDLPIELYEAAAGAG